MTRRVDDLLAQLTNEEKVDLVTGAAMWTTRPVERLDIPSLTVTDGPNGARGGGLMGTGTATACIPAGSVLGATWDPELLEALGTLLGDESVAKGANVLLAPTINLHRSPLGGRNFECYSEDPVLSGHLAAAFVRGVQSRGVATTAKHFVGNDSEFERNTIDSVIDERSLRELYLVPFEHVVKDGGGWGVMSSYNRLNGTFASEHHWLLDTVLREEWGFDGFVVSDWFALRSTAASIIAGLSLEMPGPGHWYGEHLLEAIEAGEVPPPALDRCVRDVLVALERTGAFDGVGGGEEKPLDRPEDAALIRRAAVAGTVLVANDGILPLDGSTLTKVAVIGPNARSARIMGGGSANVAPYRRTSPLDALTRRLAGQAEVVHATGCDIARTTPPLEAPLLDGPLQLSLRAGQDLSAPFTEATTLATTTCDTGSLLFFGAPAPGVPADAFSLRAVGTVLPEFTGPHAVRLVQCGRTRVLLDGQVVLDATEGDQGAGDSFFGFGSAESEMVIELEAGVPVELVIEYSNKDSILLAGATVGVVPLMERDLLGAAVALAAESDIAIVVVGTNDDWETEGRDRDQFDLPGDQPELIRRVAAANSRTIVVLNTGGVHAMDWLDAPAATLSVGFAGQELGDALVDVLFGDVDPGGRMPTTVPARYEHSPAYLNYPGENSEVRYGEGLFIGHRWFDARHIDPAVPFGHGLSYATFEWGPASAPAEQPTTFTESVTIEVEVTNTSERRGTEVVQLYVEPTAPLLQRPVRELKGFAKLELDPGETATARIELDPRAFACWDPGDTVFEALAAMAPVPAKGGERRTEPGWYVEPGVYRLVAARSATDHESVAELTLTGEDHRLDP